MSKTIKKSLDNDTFYKFRRLYLMAFLFIALTIIVAQILIQNHLDSQINDSRIINIAGRQRMLSQKIVKESLFLNLVTSKKEQVEKIEIIKENSKLFLESHKNLQNEFSELGNLTKNNPELQQLFSEVDVYHSKIIAACNSLTKQALNDTVFFKSTLQPQLNILKKAEVPFLEKMNEIVFKYDEISQQKVKELKRKEYILLIISLGILLVEMLFLFKPISIHIKNVIGDLIATKKEAQEKAQKIEELYNAKEASLQELKGLNYALDNTALFASIAQDGSLVHISKKFSNLLGLEIVKSNEKFEDVITLEEGERETLKELLKGKRKSIWVDEIQVLNAQGEKLWLEMSIIPMYQLNSNQRLLILCTDITKRKESQIEIDKLTEERFEEQVKLQKEQASQIVEAQEEERKRIAKDIHDGIGQMLTALKFNIESIKAENVEATGVKVQRLKDLLSNLIKEVRTVTFNLTPPELSDYGIVPTIQKLTEQLSSLTGKKIYFENKTDFKGRFDSLIETNLYRVVQEAVNNALKYAESDYILISISHSNQKLSIVIDDNGKGFDEQKILKTKKDAGMGLFFMKERINYIGGRIFINSTENEGTRITININLFNS